MKLYKRVKQNNRLLFIIEAVHELYLHARSASFPGDEVYVTQTENTCSGIYCYHRLATLLN